MRMLTVPIAYSLLITLFGCDVTSTIGPRENHAPVLTSSPDTVVLAGNSYTYRASVEDEDEDALSVVLLEKPEWLDVIQTGRAEFLVSGQPGREHVGLFQIELQASDGRDSTLQSFPLYVGHPEAGTYRATSFTYQRTFSGCGPGLPIGDALADGGYFDLTLGLLGAYTLRWAWSAGPSFGQSEGTYTVSGDSLMFANLDWNTEFYIGTAWQIDLPSLRLFKPGSCRLARVQLQRE